MANQTTPNPSVPSQVVAEVKFPKFINNLGIIPTSYKDSMSYYETLAWLCKYLEETVIPTVNQNGEAVEELQSLYIELNSYVTHYFDNLDVQEEINNKLNNMVKTGQLQWLLRQQYNELAIEVNERIDEIDNKVTIATSGSPAGVYATLLALSTADPDHDKIYVVLSDGKWYYYDTSESEWVAGGVYQATQISESDPIIQDIDEKIENLSSEYNTILKLDNQIGFINQSNFIIDVKDHSHFLIQASGEILSTAKEIKVNGGKSLYLEPETEYTLSASCIDKDMETSQNAMSIAIYRRDNNALVGSVSYSTTMGSNNKAQSTFTTPNYQGAYYVNIAIASTSGVTYTYESEIVFTLVKGSTPSYDGYVFDINRNLPTIQTLLHSIPVYDIIVDASGNGDYDTLTEAVQNANNYDRIYIKNGTYSNEIVKAWAKTLFIYGESREGVVIKNNSGDYDTPPIEIGTGLLKNLTIYAEKDEYSGTPQAQSYAIHSESSQTYPYFVIDNCTIKSDWRSSWGMGMRGDTEYYARNCTFEGVYFHDCEHQNRAGLQKITFDNCNIIRDLTNGTALILQDQNMEGSTVIIEFIRTLIKGHTNIVYYLWNGSGVTPLSGLEDMPNWSLSPYSWNNSISDLNPS